MSSLLEKALAEPVRSRGSVAIVAEELELAIAFFRGRVTGAQLRAALRKTGRNNGAYWAMTRLRQAAMAGLVEIAVKAP